MPELDSHLAKENRRWPATFTVQYLERGPEAWRLSLLREDAGLWSHWQNQQRSRRCMP